MTTNWTIRRTSSPQSLAVSLDEAKRHLRVSGNAQDELIQLLIESSTERLERDIERCIITATWEQTLCNFPANGEPILLHMKAASAVSSVTYSDPDGNVQTLDAQNYVLDKGRNSLVCTSNGGWPAGLVTDNGRDTVTIEFTCGQSDVSCVPRLFKHGILLEVGRGYFDPAQEGQTATDNGKSYQNIVKGLLRSSYP